MSRVMGAVMEAFDPAAFEERTTRIVTASGEKEVVYRFWRPITYLGRPVDPAHQSLVVSEPVRIDSVPVDASHGPIVFASAVGGYFPATVADASGVGEARMSTPPGFGPPPAQQRPGGGDSADANVMTTDGGRRISLAKLALASGFVVVEPGSRGRTLVDADGTYYGVAPAAIIDLKAAVRYLRANRGRVPGDPERIVTTGVSAGGALSALLGASGDSDLYADDLAAVGAADESDAVFASGCWCPIADLEHADAAYEWNWGRNTFVPAPPFMGGPVDPQVSAELAAAFDGYQRSLGFAAPGFGTLTAANYGDHLVEEYLRPAATAFLAGLTDADRAAYLDRHPRIGWADGAAHFGWDDFLAHLGSRRKPAPAFDAFDLASPENNLFGLGVTRARHFTEYALRRASGDQIAELDADLPATLALMNPMHHLAAPPSGGARHWWLRVGAADSDTSLSVVGNLALAARALGDDVDTAMYWDQGHGANTDAGAFMEWIARIAG